MRLVSLLALLCVSSVAHAQPVPGACQIGTAENSVTVADVAAKVFNTGALFFGNTTVDGTGYLVPKDTGRSPIFSAGLWLAGKVGGQLRMAAATYTGFNFWPGPLGADARPVDPADCSAYDRIYTVSRADVAAYYATGVATADLRDWPAALGAPVLDGDGDPSNYSLTGGDQPAIRGDQTVWWIMNDVGGPHVANATPPMGVEVRVEAFALDRAPLDRTTFYRYTVTNRTAEAIDSVYASVFADTDLGGQLDDYVGSDTTWGMGYTYNADDVDEIYGVPPALGVQVLEGPVGLANGRDDDRDGTADEMGERLGMTAAMYYVYVFEPGPTSGSNRYYQMRGLWGDGTPMRERGNGYQQTEGDVTAFAFNGDPVTGRVWSEVNPCAGLPPLPPDDRRFLVSTGPFRLGPGQSETVTFALPFAQGTSNLDSVTRLRSVAAAVRAVALAGGLDAVRTQGSPVDPSPPVQEVSVSPPSPNPFTDGASFVVRTPPGTPVRATLYDALGRRVAVLHDGPTDGAETEVRVGADGLAPGVYVVRVVVPAGEQTVTLVRR